MVYGLTRVIQPPRRQPPAKLWNSHRVGCAAAAQHWRKSMSELVQDRAAQRNQRGLELAFDGYFEQAVPEFSRAVFLCRGEPSYYINRGEAYYRLCDFKSALINYRRAMWLELPDVSDTTRKRLCLIAYLLGQISLERRLVEDAVRYFTLVLDQDPCHYAAYMLRSMAFLYQRQFQLALQDLDQCASLEPRDAGAFALRAKVLLVLDRVADASQDLERARNLDPNHAAVHEITERLDNFVDAQRAEAQNLTLAGDMLGASQHLRVACRIRPTDVSLLSQLAAVLRRARLFDEAEQVLQSLPEDVAITNELIRRQRALICNDRALDAAKAYQISQAVKFLNNALRLCPEDVQFLLNRGDIRMMDGCLYLAIADFHKAAEIDETCEEARARVALVHAEYAVDMERRGALPEAMWEYGEAIRWFDRSGEYYAARADVAMRLQRWENVRQDVFAALRREPMHRRANRLLRMMVPSDEAIRQLQRDGELPIVHLAPALTSAPNDASSVSSGSSASPSPPLPGCRGPSSERRDAKALPALPCSMTAGSDKQRRSSIGGVATADQTGAGTEAMAKRQQYHAATRRVSDMLSQRPSLAPRYHQPRLLNLV